MVALFLRVLLLLPLCLVDIQGKGFVKLCYFPNWAGQRVSEFARYDVQNIDPSLCTHLVYAFAQLDVENLRIVPRYHDEDRGPGQSSGRYQKFNDLKKTNKRLKTLVSIGGEYAGSEDFVTIAKNESSLQIFAKSTVDFLRKRDFDGLDIDWEYPNVTTKDYFSRLIKALRLAFDAEQNSSGKERLLLTVAMPAGKHQIQDGYNMPDLNKYVDLASLMTYDYHGGWNSVTGFDSPLFSRHSSLQFSHELSTEWTVDFYLSLGLLASKILVGITAAGTHFKLQDLNVTGVGAPVIQSDQPRLSDFWLLPDRYAYPEICRVLQTDSSERVFDEEQMVPYVFQGDDWFGYEDAQSIENKADWMLKKGVAGAMFWALDMDDFSGKLCDQGTYPLLRALGLKVDRQEEDPQRPSTHPQGNHVSDGSGSGRQGSLAVSWFPRLMAVTVALTLSMITFGCR